VIRPKIPAQTVRKTTIWQAHARASRGAIVSSMRRNTPLALAIALVAFSCGPTSQSVPDKTPTSTVTTHTGGSAAGVGAIVAASDLPQVLPKPIDGDEMGVTIHRLSNGMTVYISTDRQTPRVSAWVAVRAGSRHDPADSTGLAHYLEHMLFKGTGKLGTTDIDAERPHLERIEKLYADLRQATKDDERSKILAEIDAETQSSAKYAVPNELDTLYSKLGVQGVNAFTSNDQTVYVADVPSNRFDAWSRVEAERYSDPQFRLFFTEIETVYEEKNRSMDSPGRRVGELMSRSLYPEHQYGTQPTLGHIDHLKNPAYGDMVAFFERWYVPNNMAIVLAGDIDAATALPVLEKTFGATLVPKRLEQPEAGAIQALDGRKVYELEAEGGNTVTLAWHTVEENHPDQTALEVMDWLVDNSESGILNVELLLTQKVPSAGSYPRHYNEAGHWATWATARDDQTLDQVEALLVGVVNKLKAGDFTQADIDAVVTNAEIREKYRLESNGSRVSTMTDAFITRQSWADAVGALDRMRAVTRDDVIRVANKYLDGDFVVVRRKKGEYEPPEIDKPTITPIDIDSSRKSAFAVAVQAMDSPDLEPEWVVEGEHFTRTKLPAGEMISSRNTRNDLFSVRYRFETGRRDAKLLCHALNVLERAGTKDLPAAELKRTLYSMGTSISTGCGLDWTNLYVSGLDRHFGESIDLLESWLRTAAFDANTVDSLVANVVSRRKDRMEEPSFVGGALRAYALRAHDSSYLLQVSNRDLERSEPAALRPLLSGLLDHEHTTVYYGPRSAAEAAKIVARGSNHAKLAARPPVIYRKAEGTTVYFADKKVSQAAIRIWFPSAPLDNESRAISELYGEYIGGGMGALIFQEIREARSLAYSASGWHSIGTRSKDQSILTGSMATQNDKAIEAITTMLELLQNVPADETRFATAIEAIDRSYRATRVNPRYVGGWVLYWDEIGVTSDPRPERWKTIRGLDLAALSEFAKAVSSGKVVISVLGDAAHLDMAALNKVGKVETKTIADLVNY
jgi:predicted Zn-dependent peptidase